MFERESGSRPKRPVVSTLTAATVELKRWLEESCLTTFQDADGQPWTLGVKVIRVPDPQTTNGLLWSLKLGMTAQVSGLDLIATGVLCPDQDSRLLLLIGEDHVPLAMRPIVHLAPNEQEARQLLATVLPALKESLSQQSLVPVKRELIGRWIDEGCQFSGRLSGF